MAVRKEAWPEGCPAWTDLMVSNLEASQEFYRQLFGWEFQQADPQYGGYSNAMIGGETVAALYPTMPGAGDVPHQWLTYLAVGDAAATADKVKEAGGQVHVEPMQVGSYGTMSVFGAPDGAAFGTWQAGEHTGYTRVNEHGSVIWNEMMSRDYERARVFYTDVFGYSYDDIGDDTFTYATIKLGDRIVGGIGMLDENTPAEVPSFWGVYFGSDDVDASLARVAELGGRVVREPRDSTYGRMATAAGPDGEYFSLISAQRPWQA
ncbi:VOC family protein [Microlunatus panaciterrae]|uniref:Enzyme related to lactoylglutathione lyase n=1 Tax=Microlunatus panaciterrae TaxID=400768 RepID=A0ABS2RHG2_9ACTN|nr:VOC family protein [Microlunatus panaciterrae]MBM7798445.1 putative enzyme related to lactoylglutathione lyase [Microlunatus panaciterrae]